jgi:hypothetical protein
MAKPVKHKEIMNITQEKFARRMQSQE